MVLALTRSIPYPENGDTNTLHATSRTKSETSSDCIRRRDRSLPYDCRASSSRPRKSWIDSLLDRTGTPRGLRHRGYIRHHALHWEVLLQSQWAKIFGVIRTVD